MGGVGIMLRFLAVLLLVRLVLRGLVHLATPRQVPRRDEGGRPREDLVRDRICNTFVTRSRAVMAEVAGHQELFCSAACRDKALAARP